MQTFPSAQHFKSLDHQTLTRLEVQTQRNISRASANGDTCPDYFYVPRIREYLPLVLSNEQARFAP